MQIVLEQHPEILAYLVDGHHGMYVVPQVSLGKEFVPDFFVAGETSGGIRWHLVEQKSPIAPLSIADGQASAQLRKAIKQITDWREWLADNADYARRGDKENGLGLRGIRYDARGLIIIGRGELTDEPDAMRRRALTEQNIEVRTYDWLVRSTQTRRRLPFGLLDIEVADDDAF